MAAREHQLEPLIVNHHVFDLVHGHLGDLELACLLHQSALPAQAVDGSVTRCHHEPGRGVRRGALPRPPLGGDCKRFLNGLLGSVKVTEEADQGREYPSPLLAEDALQSGQCQCSTTGRTSTDPPSRAAGTRPATSIASSRLPASKM